MRPNGKISLGFYGEVHVAGLTVEQAKVKILKNLRKKLSDESLGLYDVEPEDWGDQQPPPANSDPFQLNEEKTPKEKTKKTSGAESGRKVRPVRQSQPQGSNGDRSRMGAQVRLLARRQEKEGNKPETPPQGLKVPIQPGHQVQITIEVQDKGAKEESPFAVAPEAPSTPGGTYLGPPIPPEQSDRVFVDVTAYNSKSYYVVGDVQVPGKLPFTGRETVMDALQYAGGLLPTAEPKEIHLVRPGSGRKTATGL